MYDVSAVLTHRIVVGTVRMLALQVRRAGSFVSKQSNWVCCMGQVKAFFIEAGWTVHTMDNYRAVARRVAAPCVDLAFNTELPTRPEERNYGFMIASLAHKDDRV